MKILIAEDDPGTLLLIESSLQEWGYEVASTKDGDEAWEAFQELHEPLVVILDWMMPGLDGLEVCRRIVRGEPEHPVHIIFLTAKTMESDVVKGYEAGASDFLKKPFDRLELKVRVEFGVRMLDMQNQLRENIKKLEEIEVKDLRLKE